MCLGEKVRHRVKTCHWYIRFEDLTIDLDKVNRIQTHSCCAHRFRTNVVEH